MHNSSLSRAFLISLFLIPAACNTGSSSGSGTSVQVGAVLEKPDQPGALYIATQHEGGKATRLHVESLSWGRLANVHDLRADGSVDPKPVFRDFLIAPGLIPNGIDFTLDTNPFTAETRVVIQREQGQPDSGNGTFEDILEDLTRDIGPIHPMGLNGSGTPASFVARNGALAIQFDDLLDDSSDARRNLAQFIGVLSGYPAITPYEARLIFDPSHGGVSGGKFHSTRVIVDFTISGLEAASHPTVLAENLLGLPQSLLGSNGVNIAIRIPTREEPSIGQFEILRNLGGSPLATTANGPTDPSSITHDIVRGMRSGNDEDVSRGFLFDNQAPEIVSNWPLTVTRAVPDIAGDPEFEFTLDLVFTSTCQKAPGVGDVIRINSRVVEVTRNAGTPAIGSGVVKGVSVRAIDGSPVFNPGSLVGIGGYRTVFDAGGRLSAACWVSFQPPARVFPSQQVPPDARVVLTFSEPMDTGSMRPFDTMRVFKGNAFGNPSATTTVVGSIESSRDLLTHAFAPALGYEHALGAAETYTLEFAGGTDLGGNALSTTLPRIQFNLDTAAPDLRAGGLVVRFADTNEYVINDPSPGGDDDFRGQMNYDLTRGLVTPRPVIRESWPMDQTTPAGSLMFPLPVGIPEPLSPMGSRLMTLWRNADLGWLVTDESKDNIDVEGISWMPFGGAVVSDYFEDFELRLAHSSRLPDEFVDSTGLLIHPASGLLDAPNAFDDNVLADPAGPKETVHQRGFGYRVDPNESFVASTGSTMMPFPLNNGSGPATTYTWRDTAIQAVGGESSAGVPQRFEVVDLGLYTGIGIGELYPAGQVPSHGLPLLMDIACYPSNQGVGANEFTLAVGRLGQLFPTARVHSTGGHNTAGRRVNKDPDTQMIPSGGFSPLSTPPGQPTRSGDPTFYFGQLDTVVRVSRAHSVWFDAQDANPDWLSATLEPAASEQPIGTQVLLHYRGATGFTTLAGQQFRASLLNSYGDLPPGRVNFLNGVSSWTSRLDDLDGAQFIQIRITFVNNIETGLSPTLDSLALAFAKR